jgi:hypothetical protein
VAQEANKEKEKSPEKLILHQIRLRASIIIAFTSETAEESFIGEK